MEQETVAASGSSPLTRDELDEFLRAAQAAKREQEAAAIVAAPMHWGNTHYGRIVGAGVFIMAVAVGLAVLLGAVALVINAAR